MWERDDVRMWEWDDKGKQNHVNSLGRKYTRRSCFVLCLPEPNPRDIRYKSLAYGSVHMSQSGSRHSWLVSPIAVLFQQDIEYIHFACLKAGSIPVGIVCTYYVQWRDWTSQWDTTYILWTRRRRRPIDLDSDHQDMQNMLGSQHFHYIVLEDNIHRILRSWWFVKENTVESVGLVFPSHSMYQ